MKFCTIDGCHREHDARGLCSLHYYRLWRRGGMVDRRRIREDDPPVCVCDNPMPDAIGECMTCRRPYRYGLLECRARWRIYLSSNTRKESYELQDQ